MTKDLQAALSGFFTSAPPPLYGHATNYNAGGEARNGRPDDHEAISLRFRAEDSPSMMTMERSPSRRL
jgi:hypothetical protein